MPGLPLRVVPRTIRDSELASNLPMTDEADLPSREPSGHDGIGEEVYEGPVGSSWRRPLLIAVAVLTAVAMALVPISNLFHPGRPVADNGLEVCGFDYCSVQQAVVDAGLGNEMSRLANTFLTDQEAERLTEILLDRLGATDVELVIVERLDRDLKGQYDPASRTILLERPVRAWIVLHEVAHVEAAGHGDGFQRILFDLTTWVGETVPLR